MIGKKLYKEDIDWNDYSATAEWCNGNNAVIEDKGEYYEVVAIPEPPPPTLEELKVRKKAEIIAARDAAIRNGTIWQDHPIYTDGDAQRLALSIISAPTLSAAIGSTAPIAYPTWTCKDGHVVQLDEAYATDLCLTIQCYVTATYNKAAGLLPQVEAAQTAEELAAVVWSENVEA